MQIDLNVYDSGGHVLFTDHELIAQLLRRYADAIDNGSTSADELGVYTVTLDFD